MTLNLTVKLLSVTKRGAAVLETTACRFKLNGEPARNMY